MKIWRQGTAVLVILLLLVGVIQFSPQALYGEEAKNMEGIMATKLQGVIALYLDSPLALVNNAETELDSSNEFITPLLVAGRVLVPVRFVAESLGGTVLWNEETQAITINVGEKVIRLTLHKPELQVNGKSIALEVAPETYLDRTYVPLRAVSEAFGKKVDYQSSLVTIADSSANLNLVQDTELWEKVRARLNNLPVLGSEENLQKLLEAARVQGSRIMYGLDSALMKTAEATPAPSANAGSIQYSQTNIQVQGVDEADLVKTDGKYIYQVSGQKVIISQVYPADAMKVVAVLNSGESSFSPQELYVDQDNLVIIGSSQTNMPMPLDLEVNAKMIMPPYYYTPKVKAVIYSIRDKQNITKTRELELDGNYVSSRKIGSALYLITNKYINYYPGLGQDPIILPAYRDSAVKAEDIQIPYSQIRCFPPVLQANYLLIAGLDLAKPKEAVQVSTYLGSGENIYVSEKHLFVAVSQQESYYSGRTGILGKIVPENRQEKTLVFKFALNQGKVTYLQKGEVPGRILNQFSMDEFQGNFRIATTVGHSWNSGDQTSRNNLYVLDSGMGIIGQIQDIAPGEQIYSTRFMGERAYMVTFKTVDPLFVLDLSNPQKPQILGALKIPGYSDYLHPYDANHLIGFGKDTVELPQKDYQGKVVGTMAYYLGMKIALFDVTDVANPKELFSEKIGDRGTSSELLHNHKALLFDKEKGLMALPVTVMQVPAGTAMEPSTGMPPYGQFSFQGAYVYNLDLSKGFALKGKITHLTPEDYLKAGYSGSEPDKQVNRILYINDTLYTLSNTQIKANELAGLEEKNNLLLP